MIAIALLVALLVITYTAYVFSKRKFNYWEKKKIPHLQPVPLFGNFADFILQKKYVGQNVQKICQNFPNAPLIGAYYGTQPSLIIQDPDLLKLIMAKDFYYFSTRGNSEYSQNQALSQNLFSTDGDKWKVLRQNMTPLFSSAKMKNMFHLIENCSHVFENLLDQEYMKGNEIQVRTLMARYTMDCIGSCAFGVDTNVMEKDKDNPFKKIGDLIFDVKWYGAILNVIRDIWPATFYGLGLRSIPKSVEDFFINLLTGIFVKRQYKPSSRNDFVDLMLKLNNNKIITGDSLTNMKSDSGKKVNLEVNDNLLLAQCTLFFAAGFETSATTLSYTLFELAKNPETQDRALEEVDRYMNRHDNKLKYECVAECQYLDACTDEALRLYPVAGVIPREVVEDYTFPNGLKVEKGLRIQVPVYHLHHSPDLFPEPENYRPERFLGEEKQNIRPYTFIPFGDGPRICIGMRFAKMQMIAGLITILKKYRLELAPGMKRDVVFDPRSVVTQPIGGIKLKLIEREGWEQRVLK